MPNVREVAPVHNVLRPIAFPRLVKQVADRFGTRAATEWTKTVLGHAAQINEHALRAAIASRNLKAIEAVVNATGLQAKLQRALVAIFQGAASASGTLSLQQLQAHGVTITFNATHPDVVRFAREQAAELVKDVPKQTKQIIAEVIARGAERGLTVEQQARAIRETVGLPPNWANAPAAMADELRAGEISAATSRRMSAVMKQKIRSAARNDQITETFIKRMQAEYTQSLINARALTIARTETLRASNFGITQSWWQAQQAGDLPGGVKRVWLVTHDSRLSPQHARIPSMNPYGRGLNEPFFTTEGIHMYPPSRPNCRCTVGLIFGGRAPR